MLALALTSSTRASAGEDRALELAERLDGKPLGRLVDVLVDESGTLALTDILQPAMQARFRALDHDAPSFGFTEDTYWLRLSVRNDEGVARAWLLELAYPHLDHVILYRPDGRGGFVARTTGDSYPFSQRDLDYRNFVFDLGQPAHSSDRRRSRAAARRSETAPPRTSRRRAGGVHGARRGRCDLPVDRRGPPGSGGDRRHRRIP